MTEFADAAVLLPLAAGIFLWLRLSRVPSAAAWWAAAVAFCAATTAGLKIFFWGCPPVSDLHSPSGHTSLGTAVYGATALIGAVESSGWRARIAAVAGAGFILAIGVSRLLLDVHSIPEVLAGWIIGGAALAVFGRAYRRAPPERARLAPLLIGVAALAAALHGGTLHAEEFLHRITGFLHVSCR